MGVHMQILIAILLGIKRNWHIFFGLIAGIIVGILFPAANYPMAHKILDITGQAFISIIQMVVIPLVISAIVIGISSIGDNKQLAKFGKNDFLLYDNYRCSRSRRRDFSTCYEAGAKCSKFYKS